MVKTRVLSELALPLANAVVSTLRPYCSRIEIAGSLRRGCATVGDIEIVAVPLPILDLFGEPVRDVSVLDSVVRELWGQTITKNGPKYKQFKVGNTILVMQVDLFLATADNWGLIYMLRTGGSEFSHRMVTPRKWGGYMPEGYVVKDGSVWWRGATVPVPDETTLFRLWEMDAVTPRER